MTTDNPFAVLAGITLTDPERTPLLGPPTGYERWVALKTVPCATGMTDTQALDYAEALGFLPEMFAELAPRADGGALRAPRYSASR